MGGREGEAFRVNNETTDKGEGRDDSRVSGRAPRRRHTADMTRLMDMSRRMTCTAGDSKVKSAGQAVLGLKKISV